MRSAGSCGTLQAQRLCELVRIPDEAPQVQIERPSVSVLELELSEQCRQKGGGQQLVEGAVGRPDLNLEKQRVLGERGRVLIVAFPACHRGGGTCFRGAGHGLHGEGIRL